MPSSVEIHRNLIQRVNVGDSLTRTAARYPGALALADGTRRLTYREFNSLVNRVRPRPGRARLPPRRRARPRLGQQH